MTLIDLPDDRRSASLVNDVANKSVKIREVNFKSYPLYEIDNNGKEYLAIRNSEGIVIRHQYFKSHNRKKQMTDIEISSPFWKAKENLEVGDVFEIMSEGEATPYPTKTDPNNKVWDFQLKKADGTEKSCRLNTKILVALKTKFGADMAKWIGTSIEAKEINKMAKGHQIVWEIK